jgi:hypothetical protein
MGNETKKVAIRGMLAMDSIYICLARAPNVEISILEQSFTSLIESRMITWVEIWGLEDGLV